MGALEQVQQMKEQGMPDSEIIKNLREQGISPLEINNALDQMQIKSAISSNNMEEMQQSGMDGEGYAPSENYSEAPQQTEGGYYPQENTGYEGGYSQGGGGSSDIMIEISEQVFAEKIKKIQDTLDELVEFKTLTQTKIDHFSERLKRIETIIDKLQISILEKVGSYGTNIEGIKKEMQMMQDSFSKTLPGLVKRK